MNLWIVCHGEYWHASMQEDELLAIRSTGLCCNLEHKFRKSSCINVQLVIFGFHEQYRELKCCFCLFLFHLYVKDSGTLRTEEMQNFLYMCIQLRYKEFKEKNSILDLDLIPGL